MRCPRCSADVPSDGAFCHVCGEHLAENDPHKTPSTHATPASALRDRGRSTVDMQEDEERELWRGSFSAKALIHYWIVAVGLSVVLPVGAARAAVDTQAWLLLAAALLSMWGVLAIVVVYRKLNVSYELTNQRFVHNLGILTRYTHRIEVIDFDDVGYRQGILERLVGVGTIAVHSSDVTDPVLVIPGIDCVRDVAELMDEARRAERVRRGLHIEAV